MSNSLTRFDDHLLRCSNLPWYKGVFVFSVGAFITVFLVLFQPFGVTNFDPRFQINLEFLVSMIGVGTSVGIALAMSEFVLRPLVLPNPGRVGLLLWLAWDYLLTGSVAFLYYNYLGDWHDWRWASYFRFLPDVWMMMTFPVVGFIFYLKHEGAVNQLIDLSIAMPPAPPVQGADLLRLTSENEKDFLIVAPIDLLYLEAQDNYVAVAYLLDGERKTRLLRSTLARMVSMVPGRFLRCHRSFVVNLERVRNCQGNQHGLQLHLQGTSEAVPVSRAFVQAVLDALEDARSPGRPAA